MEGDRGTMASKGLYLMALPSLLSHFPFPKAHSIFRLHRLPAHSVLVPLNIVAFIHTCGNSHSKNLRQGRNAKRTILYTHSTVYYPQPILLNFYGGYNKV